MTYGQHLAMTVMATQSVTGERGEGYTKGTHKSITSCTMLFGYAARSWSPNSSLITVRQPWGGLVSVEKLGTDTHLVDNNIEMP